MSKAGAGMGEARGVLNMRIENSRISPSMGKSVDE